LMPSVVSLIYSAFLAAFAAFFADASFAMMVVVAVIGAGLLGGCANFDISCYAGRIFLIPSVLRTDVVFR
jgi:hypothetical protein